MHEAREQEPGLSFPAVVKRIEAQAGVQPDTLRRWSCQAEIDQGRRSADLRSNLPSDRPGVPVPSSAEVALRMSKQARVGTGPELALRRLLHAEGKRYRVAWPVPGMRRRSIDIAFTRAKVAVNVHGCFWHGCPVHGTSPKSNAAWWRAKINKNRTRDVETRQHLEDQGWTVVEVWEHEDAEDALRRVLTELADGSGDAGAPR